VLASTTLLVIASTTLLLLASTTLLVLASTLLVLASSTLASSNCNGSCSRTSSFSVADSYIRYEL